MGRNLFIVITLGLLYMSLCMDTIILPFKKMHMAQPSMNESEIFRHFKKLSYAVEIEIGTPPQKILLDINTESHMTFVYTTDSYFKGIEPDGYIGFDEKESKTYTSKGGMSAYNIVFEEAKLFEDTCKFGRVYDNFCLILGVGMKDTAFLTRNSGQIGLDLINEVDIQGAKSNLVQNLKEKGIIQSYDYFFEFDNDMSGRVVIGATPNQYNPSKYKNQPNNYARQPSEGRNVIWGFTVDKVFYNGEQIKEVFNYANIKLEYGLLGVGPQIKTVLDEKVFNQLKSKGICRELEVATYGYRGKHYLCNKGTFDKNKLGKLGIYNMEFDKTFEIDLSKLFQDIGDTSFFLVEFITDKTIILGDFFIKQNELTFNQDMKMIGMYVPDSPKGKDKSRGLLIFLVVLIIFASIVVVSLILMLIYKSSLVPRKKRETELVDEDYEYVPYPNKK